MINSMELYKSIYFVLILSFPESQFDSFGAAAGVRVALDRINSDPYLLQNYTLRYTLSDSKVCMYICNVMFKNHTIIIIVFVHCEISCFVHDFVFNIA